MEGIYTETPYNLEELMPYVVTDVETCIFQIYQKKICYFYDACSFRIHANLGEVKKRFLKYVQTQDGLFIITRSILMELASLSGELNPEYISYGKEIMESGITLLLMYEEDFFSVMEVVFSQNAVINNYLSWAVRLLHKPGYTVYEVMNTSKPGEDGTALINGEPDYNDKWKELLLKANGLEKGDLFHKFFSALRSSKHARDNLGEEVLAICLYLLSYIPGEPDSKFRVITDDKGAAGCIAGLVKRTNKKHAGRGIVICSTPKLAQMMYKEDILTERNQLVEFVSAGVRGNVVVLGSFICDFENHEISLNSKELADYIMLPNGINIIF